MRNPRHPIAMFIITVLVVIAIGVGIVAATTNQKVYGPSWGRFTAAFSGQVQEQGVSSFKGQTAVGYNSSVIYERQNPPILHGRTAVEDHISAQHLSEVVASQDLREMAVRLGAAFPPLRREPREDTDHVNGFMSVRLGPSCALDIGQTFCVGVWIVARNRTIWVLSGTSFLGLGPAAAFLDSFEPMG